MGWGISLALPWELGNTSYPHSGLLLTPSVVLDPSFPHTFPHSVFSSGHPSPLLFIAPVLVFDISRLRSLLPLASHSFFSPFFFQSPNTPIFSLSYFLPHTSLPSYSLFVFLHHPSSLFPILTPPPSSPLSCSPSILLWAKGIPHLFKQKKKELLH